MGHSSFFQMSFLRDTVTTLSAFTPNAVFLLSLLTVLGQIIILVLLVSLFTKRDFLHRLFDRYGVWFLFITALIATLGSLFFSEIAGWTPCKECWLQRIFMYPQTLLLTLALWKRDKHIAPYILFLCLVGMVISISHYTEQVQAALQPPTPANPLQPCDASGVSCASTQIHFTFGYITIPMMALTAFVMNALGSLHLMLKGKEAVA